MSHLRSFAHLLLVLALLLPGQATAHAFPLHSIPGPGAVLAQMPAAVTVRFDSDLEPRLSVLIVKDEQGTQVSEGNGKVAATDHKVLSTRLTVAHRGVYHVYWRALTPDGHRTEGDYFFTVQ